MKKIIYIVLVLFSVLLFKSSVEALDFNFDKKSIIYSDSIMAASDVLPSAGEAKVTSDNKTSNTSSSDYFQICNASKNPQLVASFKLIGIFVTIVKIIVPVILIIMGSIDMSKAVVSKDNDAIQRSLAVFIKRAMAGVLVFFAPSIILGIFHMVDGMDNFDSAYKTCVDCILGSSSCPNVSFIQGS